MTGDGRTVLEMIEDDQNGVKPNLCWSGSFINNMLPLKNGASDVWKLLFLMQDEIAGWR